MVAVEIEPVCVRSSMFGFPRKVIGNGSFGVVYQAKLCETGEMVAIKKVLQDKRFKNRELQVSLNLLLLIFNLSQHNYFAKQCSFLPLLPQKLLIIFCYIFVLEL